jgi:sodium transport system ATP-binding protein
VIEIRSLCKKFGTVEAVRDVSFSAGDGTVVGLLGPNGAGKTTTLRMLSGLMRPDAGTIVWTKELRDGLRDRRSILSLLDLNEIADRRVSGFSLGERTKVALARALVHQPRNDNQHRRAHAGPVRRHVYGDGGPRQECRGE